MNTTPSPKVLRDDLIRLDPPRFIGTKCAACGCVSFPLRDFCPSCGSRDAISESSLSPNGVVHTYTVIRQAPGGQPVPYILAYVDLADKVRVLAQVDQRPELICIGMPVKADFRQVRIDDGHPVIGYVFVPDEERTH